MKLIVSALFILFGTASGHSQSNSAGSDPFIPATDGREHSIDMNSTHFNRIFDGFLLGDEKVPDIKINDVRLLNDTAKLKAFSLQDFSKPYMILNSEVTELRNYIYARSHINREFNNINIPLTINKELIVPDKYYLLAGIDAGNIKSAVYTAKIPAYLVKSGMALPFGVIEVTTAE